MHPHNQAPDELAGNTSRRPATVRRRWMFLALALFGLTAIGATYYHSERTSELENMLSAKTQEYDLLADLNAKAEQEVSKLRLTLDEMAGQNAELDRQVAAARTALAQREAKIRELKELAKSNEEARAKLAAEVAELKGLNERLENDLDASQLVNHTGAEQMQALQASLSSVQQELSSLKAQAEQAASKMGAYGIRLTLWKVKGARVTAVEKPKQANKVKVEFELGENSLAQTSKRTLRVRLQAPGRQPAEWNREIPYDGSRQKLVFESTALTDLTEGIYTVTVYEGETVLGSESVSFSE